MTKKRKIAILKAALKLFGPRGKNWIKGKYDIDGVKFCAIGALHAAAPKGVNGLPDDLFEQVPAKSTGFWDSNGVDSVEAYNDAKRRKFADIKALYLRTIKFLSK